MQKLTLRFLARLGFLAIILTPFTAGAWGRRGHQIVGETAALVASTGPQAGFLRDHSFDIAYYANVPDFVWKGPATYDTEKVQHYMDMEIFDRELKKHPEVENPLALSRTEFEAKFPEIKPAAGRAFWRVRELVADLDKTTDSLRTIKEKTNAAKRKLQERWLLVAGVVGHYIGDLGMPLHLSENHDGEMTGQKGVHSYFEDVMVNDLYPDLDCDVNKEAKKRWPAFTKKNHDKTVLQLLEQLQTNSTKEVPHLLAMDKKMKREKIKENAKTYRPMIVQRMVDSALTLAELYRRELGWEFDDNKFYFFAGTPEYIWPEGVKH